jgi:hypothetical protein
MIHILGGVEWSSLRFGHAAQNSMLFKTCMLFVSGIFHIKFLDCCWKWVTEAMEIEAMDKKGTTVLT